MESRFLSVKKFSGVKMPRPFRSLCDLVQGHGVQGSKHCWEDSFIARMATQATHRKINFGVD